MHLSDEDNPNREGIQALQALRGTQATQITTAAPLSKKARGKQPARRRSPSPLTEGEMPWLSERVQLRGSCGKQILSAFSTTLGRLNANQVNRRFRGDLGDSAYNLTNDEYEVQYQATGPPMATVSAHSVKDMVTRVDNDEDVQDLIKYVSELFQKNKTTNLAIIINCSFIEKRVNQGGPLTPTQAAPISSTQTTGRKRGRTTETTQQRQRRQVDIDQTIKVVTGNYIIQLTRQLQCIDKTCGNFGFNCYPFGKMGHLWINNVDL